MKTSDLVEKVTQLESAEEKILGLATKIDILNLEKSELENLLETWPNDRGILFCNEMLAGEKVKFPKKSTLKWAILIGPEGGFSVSEQTKLNNNKLILFHGKNEGLKNQTKF